MIHDMKGYIVTIQNNSNSNSEIFWTATNPVLYEDFLDALQRRAIIQDDITIDYTSCADINEL